MFSSWSTPLRVNLCLETNLARICLIDLIVVTVADFRPPIQLIHIKEVIQCILVRNAHTKYTIDHQIFVKVVFTAQHAEFLHDLSKRSGRTEFRIDINVRRRRNVLKGIPCKAEAILRIVNAVADDAGVKCRAAALCRIVKTNVTSVRVDTLLLICRAALVVIEVDAYAQLAILRTAANIAVQRNKGR